MADAAGRRDRPSSSARKEPLIRRPSSQDSGLRWWGAAGKGPRSKPRALGCGGAVAAVEVAAAAAGAWDRCRWWPELPGPPQPPVAKAAEALGLNLPVSGSAAPNGQTGPRLSAANARAVKVAAAAAATDDDEEEEEEEEEPIGTPA